MSKKLTAKDYHFTYVVCQDLIEYVIELLNSNDIIDLDLVALVGASVETLADEYSELSINWNTLVVDLVSNLFVGNDLVFPDDHYPGIDAQSALPKDERKEALKDAFHLRELSEAYDCRESMFSYENSDPSNSVVICIPDNPNIIWVILAIRAISNTFQVIEEYVNEKEDKLAGKDGAYVIVEARELVEELRNFIDNNCDVVAQLEVVHDALIELILYALGADNGRFPFTDLKEMEEAEFVEAPEVREALNLPSEGALSKCTEEYMKRSENSADEEALKSVARKMRGEPEWY